MDFGRLQDLRGVANRQSNPSADKHVHAKSQGIIEYVYICLLCSF